MARNTATAPKQVAETANAPAAAPAQNTAGGDETADAADAEGDDAEPETPDTPESDADAEPSKDDDADADADVDAEEGDAEGDDADTIELLNAGLIRMRHPDNGSCDLYDTDADGNLLVPVADAGSMIEHGFAVVED